MKIILKIKEDGQFLPVSNSQIRKDLFANTIQVSAIIVIFSRVGVIPDLYKIIYQLIFKWN